MPHFFAMKHKLLVKTLFPILAFLGFAIAGWFAFVRPDWLLLIGILTSLPGYFLLLVCFTPAGNVRLGSVQESLPWHQWIIAVAKGHAVLAIFTVTVFLGFFGGGPAFMDKMNFVAGLTAIQAYTRWQWGIFPWGVFGLWGLTIAYVAYVKMGPPYLYAIAKGLWPKRLEPPVKTFIEATQFGATALGLAIVATAIILLFTYFFEKITQSSHFVLIPLTLSFLSLFVLFFSVKSTRLKMRRLHTTLTLNHLFTFCIVGAVGLLALGALANQWFIQHYPQIVPQSVCHQCGDYFRTVPQETRFAALYWGWWLTWVPLGGSYLAKYSKGRTLRQFVLGLYAFPLGLWLAVKGLSVMPWSSQSMAISPGVILGLLIILPFLAWWLLAKILKNANNSGFMLSGYMHVPERFRRNRLWVNDASKEVGLSKYSARITMALFATLFLHTTAGWYGIQIQLTAMAVMTINAIYSALDFMVIRFFKDKTWSNNQNIPPL